MATEALKGAVLKTFAAQPTKSPRLFTADEEKTKIFYGPTSDIITIATGDMILSLSDQAELTPKIGYLFISISGIPDDETYTRLAELDRFLEYRLSRALRERGHDDHAVEVRRKSIRSKKDQALADKLDRR